MNQSAWIGIDVSKKHLDVYRHPMGQYLRVTNDSPGIEQLLTWLEQTEMNLVVMEATGKLERLVLSRVEGSKHSGVCWPEGS